MEKRSCSFNKRSNLLEKINKKLMFRFFEKRTVVYNIVEVLLKVILQVLNYFRCTFAVHFQYDAFITVLKLIFLNNI